MPVGSAEWNEFKLWAGRWIDYVGVRRLVAGSVVAISVGLASWYLVKPSGASIESMLPVASASAPVSPSLTVPQPVNIVVHVAGAVKKPGVYSLPTTARVVDAVAMAGGATSQADLESINLAQTIVDTEQVFVPKRTVPRSIARVAPRLRPRRNTSSSPRGTTVTTLVSSSPTPTSGATARVNLNTATATQLDTLPGVGPTTARAIISYRTKNGPFRKIEDLLNVPGIGPSKLAALRDRVTI